MRRPRSPIEVGLFLFANSVGGLLLLISALLRELPEFWRNSGGYPLLLLVLAGTSACTVMTMRFYADNRKTGRDMLIVCAFQWLMLLVILVIMLWNNVQNLLNGHPLHYHPDI